MKQKLDINKAVGQLIEKHGLQEVLTEIAAQADHFHDYAADNNQQDQSAWRMLAVQLSAALVTVKHYKMSYPKRPKT